MLKIERAVTVHHIYTAFEMVLDRNFHFDGERHNYWELLFIEDGKVGVATDDAVYELSKGEIILYSPMLFHRIWSSQGEPHIIIMSFSLSGSGLEMIKDGVFVLNDYAVDLLKSSLASSIYCFEFNDSIRNQLIASKLEELLLVIMQTKSQKNAEKQTAGTENFKIIVKFLNDNVYNSLTLDEIASKCGFSLSNIKKIFKTYSGIGVKEYFNNLKILKSIELIFEDKSMREISDILGFSTQHYFTESFKRHCDMTPTQYKKIYKG